MTKIVIAVVLLLSACAQEQTVQQKDAIDLVPLNNEISGWTRSGAMDIAENDDQLFGFIDGEGQAYVDHGFVKFVRQRFQGDVSGTTRQLELRIVDMGDTTRAKAIYDEVGTGVETPWTEQGHAGMEARIDETLLFDYRIDFWDDKFYAWIMLYEEKSSAGLSIAKLFAINISEEIRDTTQGE